MDRRGFLASSTSAALLAGCATLPERPVATTTEAAHGACLPPVLVAENRIIRTVAGLRPYRESGFVVRAENLGSKRLVHNYGHGGAGITLSWGSSRLATGLGLAAASGPVAVLGAGVMGLSTALMAQERGYAVTIYTENLPPHTTSNIAGGQIFPASLYEPDAVDDAWMAQFIAAMDYSWRRFQLMVGDDYGIRWLPTYEGAGGGTFDPYQPGAEILEDSANPFHTQRIRRYFTMYVETGRYLRQLTADFLRAGGRFVIRRFETPSEVAGLPESVVFNCTGLGARDLFGDEGMVPKRGQLAILIPQPEVQYAYSIGSAYMFPRADGIVLGGTFETGVGDPVTTPEGIARIIQRHKALVPSTCKS
ncbi:FAD-dependent oxidoreductase [Altererythrobacter salegens]|uniref:D-amino-acid oxidase n=1 Tax=Croceibacterium salegens TaxID=1737568 RepID=A0A6I4SRL6_9SPHN|nr:FAD-dependent oxidoreductase [Croceibacterium salegens]MXO58503.1 FAD-dependent oxidoreductase [Croceibacterium salegens]